MNKAELVEAIAKQANLSSAQAARVYSALMKTTRALLKKEGTVTLNGLGTFAVAKSAGQPGGRGAETGAPRIPPRGVVKFKPGKEMRDMF